MRFFSVLLIVVAVLSFHLLPAEAATFEAGAIEKVLEAYGLMDPNAGSLSLTYEVRRDGEVVISVKGHRPGLRDVDTVAFQRVVYLATGGSDHVSFEKARVFLERLKFAMAVFEDRRVHDTARTASRFGITSNRVKEIVEYYLNLFGSSVPPRSLAPGIKFSA